MTIMMVGLVLSNLGTLGMCAYAVYVGSKERARLVNHIVARTPSEALMLNRADIKKKPVVEERPVEFPIGLS